MLMVIFGAGASFDSVPSRPPEQYPDLEHRLPLANDLFADRKLFTETMTSFHEFIPLVPLLRRPPANLSVEGMLQQFQTEADRYPIRLRQLAAIQFYLHMVIWECQRYWQDVAKITNYATLLDQIELWRGKGGYESVCLVTFNYDTLLENALPFIGVRIQDIADYIGSKVYKIIKVHGSMNWARDVKTPIDNILNKNAWQVAHELIEKAEFGLELTDTYRIVSSHPIGTYDTAPNTRVPNYPALAIPVESKRDFACPGNHLDVLRECIPQITKVLIVGWRGVEAHFVELLRGLNRPTGIGGVVVGGQYEWGNEVAVRLQHLNVSWRPSHAGFTEWITNGEATTPSARASSRRSSASCSIDNASRLRWTRAWPFSTSSKAGTTHAAAIPPSTTSRP